MNEQRFLITKYACWSIYPTMACIFSLPPMLFLTFREMYGISYTLLGTLVLVNFCTQLAVDLIFSMFSKYFNIKKTVCLMPLLTTVGLLIYALVPFFFPQYAYAGMLIGTVTFSVAAGLSETLISPIIAAVPSEHPDREMSFLHSLFAYGVLGVVVVSTLFFNLFGTYNWVYLTLFFAILPLVSFGLFCAAPIPTLGSAQESSAPQKKGNKRGILLCVLCIFFGSAAENTMSNWVSGYIENVLGISKKWGDLIGLAVFAVLLGLGRTLYAKHGKHIFRVLLLGMIGAAVCYLVAGVSTNVVLSMLACVLTGFGTSMLWPGTLILMEQHFPAAGVAAYALMAAGGDMGASIAPQLMGIVVDAVSVSDWARALSVQFAVSPDQIGMKVGMLIAALFPLCGVLVLVYIKRFFKQRQL